MSWLSVYFLYAFDSKSFINTVAYSFLIYPIHCSFYYCFFSRVTEKIVNESEKNLNAEKLLGNEDETNENKETYAIEIEKKEPDDKVKVFV